MDGLKCGKTQCGEALGSGDASCGSCGTPVPGPQRAPSRPGLGRQPTGWLNGQQDAGPIPTGPSIPFFGHEPRRRPRPLNDATRYLCAAAYLNDRFANRVIHELIATRRAVAPSLNVDLGPILWHCQRARRNLLIRNIVLIAIVVLGFIVSPTSAISFVLYVFALGWLALRARWKQRGPTEKLLFVFAVLGVLSVLGLISTLLPSGILITSFTSAFGSSRSVDGAAVSAASEGFRDAAIFTLMLALAWGTEFAFTRVTFRILIDHLRLGTPPPPCPAPGPADDRIAMVEGAQWGNIALYATDDPFMGAGVEVEVERHWSIAIRLDPADPARQVLQTRPASDDYVPIDPVELHEAIREKLLSLNDPSLPVNERIAALSVSDRLVGSGLLRWDSPLVDKRLMTPYSHASQEAIDAIIRHPQSGLRYYQHVAVCDEGPPVTVGDHKVLDRADHGIAISAFVYAAVEGRHFYLQFVLTALPPISPEYRIIDFLPSLSSGKMLRTTLWYSFKRFFGATAASPAGIIGAFRIWLAARRIEGRAPNAHGALAGDLGAEASVRELGMANRFGSHVRLLDVEKYDRIIERSVLDTVQDFLSGQGVDVSAFAGSAFNVINGNFIGSISGGVNQVGGSGSTFNQQPKSNAR
jgi:hypothetical protein